MSGYRDLKNLEDRVVLVTGASSGLGESGSLLAEMAGTGNWLEGRRFSSGANESEITAWVETLQP